MQRFNYQAKTGAGKKVAGLVEAVSEENAIELLHKRKLIVLSLEKKKEKTSFSGLLGRVSSKDVVEFTRQLATMIGVGLTLTKSLTILEEQAKPAMAKILGAISRKIEEGSAFYQALAENPQIFPKIYISLVKSGESAGKLDQVLEELAELLERQEAFKKKVKGALVYPAILITAMIIVIFIMMVYVVPKLTEVYQEMDIALPLPTRILIGTSRVVSRFWYLIFALIGGGVYGFIQWKKTTAGRKRFDQLILKVPVIGNLMKKVILTQMTRTLAMLVRSGVPIIESLGIVAEAADNFIFERSIREAARNVEKGFSLTSALEKYEEYPVVVIQMVAVGEETGRLDEVLKRVADYFEEEVEMAIKSLTTAIEPLMIIVLGLGVGFIVMSVIMPIYNLTTQF